MTIDPLPNTFLLSSPLPICCPASKAFGYDSLKCPTFEWGAVSGIGSTRS